MEGGIAERHEEFRALREELAERTYLTISEVAEHYGVSESTIRKIPDALLPTVDVTPTSQNRHIRIRPDDAHTLWKRLRQYEQAEKEGRGEEYLEELRTRWEKRERQEAEVLTEGVA